MNKISFPKIEESLTMDELGVLDAPGVVFTFWKNPSKPVVIAIAEVVMAAADELRALDKIEMERLEERYYNAICELIVDCNISSLSFDTPENARLAFEANDVPIGFVHQVITSYLSHLLKFNEGVKKALALWLVGSAFGNGNATKGEKSTTTSSLEQNPS